MGSYGWGKHLPKELRAVSGMFLSYLQFHHVTQDDQNNISLPGWMIYEDWEIQAFSCAVSHWDYSLLPPLPSPQNITHSQPGFAPTKNLAENTHPPAYISQGKACYINMSIISLLTTVHAGQRNHRLTQRQLGGNLELMTAISLAVSEKISLLLSLSPLL